MQGRCKGFQRKNHSHSDKGFPSDGTLERTKFNSRRNLNLMLGNSMNEQQTIILPYPIAHYIIARKYPDRKPIVDGGFRGTNSVRFWRCFAIIVVWVIDLAFDIRRSKSQIRLRLCKASYHHESHLNSESVGNNVTTITKLGGRSMHVNTLPFHCV